MDTRIIAVIIVSVLFIVISWLSFKKSKSKGPINLLPNPIPITDEQEYKMLQLYLDEWRETISTQMHFNDLILRFRSVILTAFVTLIGAAFAVQKFAKSVLGISMVHKLSATKRSMPKIREIQHQVPR